MPNPNTPLKDPREMRKILDEAAYRGVHPLAKQWDYPLSVTLVHNLMEFCRYNGFSGEDTMTVIAYHLLLEVERLGGMVMRDLATRPAKFIVPKVD